jgi:hypothetical protein
LLTIGAGTPHVVSDTGCQHGNFDRVQHAVAIINGDVREAMPLLTRLERPAIGVVTQQRVRRIGKGHAVPRPWVDHLVGLPDAEPPVVAVALPDLRLDARHGLAEGDCLVDRFGREHPA